MGAGCLKNQYDIRIQQLSIKLQNRRTQFSNLDSKNNQNEIANINLTSTISSLTLQLAELNKRIGKQKQEIFVLQQNIQRQQSQLADKQRQRKSLNDTAVSCTYKIQNTQKNQQERKKTKQLKDKTYGDLKSQYEKKNQQIKRLEGQKTTLENAHRDNFANYRQIEQLRGQIVSNRCKSESLQNQIQDLKNSLNKIQKDNPYIQSINTFSPYRFRQTTLENAQRDNFANYRQIEKLRGQEVSNRGKRERLQNSLNKFQKDKPYNYSIDTFNRYRYK